MINLFIIINLDIFYIDGEIPEQPEETEEVTND